MRISLLGKSHAVSCAPMRCTSLFLNLKNYGLAAIRSLHPKTPCSQPAAINHASNHSKPIIQCRSASQNGASASGKGNKDESRGPWLIVGLGNPGAQYEDTRHNVGFKVVDMIAGDNGISMTRLERRAALGKGTVEGRKVLLAKPMTFMNNSGDSVADLANFYKVPLSRVVLVYDDLDTDVGVVRLKMKGGHGGHNGMRSIMARLKGSEDSPRVKIGIGRPAGRKTVVEHVLQPFSKTEAQEMEIAVQEAADVLRSILVLGMEKALSGCRL